MLAQNFSNAITLTEYKPESAGCDDRNAIVKAANFPLQCSFNNEGNSVVGFVQTIDEGLNSGKYDVYQDTFYEDVCSSFSGALSFNTTTGTCIEARHRRRRRHHRLHQAPLNRQAEDPSCRSIRWSALHRKCSVLGTAR
jgi:hypothetical protein